MTLLVPAISVHADETEGTKPAATTQASGAPEQQAPIQTMSRRDAFLASDKQIVLHYGDGVKNVEVLAKIIVDDGYPAVAFAGGKPNEVSLFVGRGIFGPYDQDDVYNGELGLHAVTFYKERVAP